MYVYSLCLCVRACVRVFALYLRFPLCDQSLPPLSQAPANPHPIQFTALIRGEEGRGGVLLSLGLNLVSPERSLYSFDHPCNAFISSFYLIHFFESWAKPRLCNLMHWRTHSFPFLSLSFVVYVAKAGLSDLINLEILGSLMGPLCFSLEENSRIWKVHMVHVAQLSMLWRGGHLGGV